MIGKDFGGDFHAVSQFVDCDGRVLLLTNRKVYVFNPPSEKP
jgi:hypothetical protein